MKKPFKDSKVAKFLTNVAPTVLDVVGSTVFPPATQIANAIRNSDEMTEEQKEDAFKHLEKYEMELDYNYKNTSNARKYNENLGALADKIAFIIMYFNLPAIVILIGLEIWSMDYFKEQIEVHTIIATIVGIAIKSLFDERAILMNYLYGSSAEKDKTQNIKE